MFPDVLEEFVSVSGVAGVSIPDVPGSAGGSVPDVPCPLEFRKSESSTSEVVPLVGGTKVGGLSFQGALSNSDGGLVSLSVAFLLAAG